MKKVLTRCQYFPYKRSSTLNLHSTTAHEKEIHFTISLL